MHGLQHTGAFVVQFTDGTDLGAGQAAGRVEHVASGQALRFESLAALLGFVARVLEGARRQQQAQASLDRTAAGGNNGD